VEHKDSNTGKIQDVREGVKEQQEKEIEKLKD
jgi:hypothetical protein